MSANQDIHRRPEPTFTKRAALAAQEGGDMREPKKWVTKHKIVLAWRWWSDGDPEPVRLLASATAAEREGDGDCLVLTRDDGTMAMHSGDFMVRFDDGYSFAIPAQAFMRLFGNGVGRIEPRETRKA